MERNAIPDMYVDGSHLRADDQDLRFAKVSALMNLARARVAEDPQGTTFDLQKLEKEYIDISGVPEEQVTKDTQGNSDTAEVIERLKELLSSPLPDGSLAGSPLAESAGQLSPGLGSQQQGSASPGSARPIAETDNVLTSPLQRAATGIA